MSTSGRMTVGAVLGAVVVTWLVAGDLIGPRDADASATHVYTLRGRRQG